MQHLKKLTLTLALLITAAAGAWAQESEPEPGTMSLDDTKSEATMEMPAYDVTVSYELVRDITVQTQYTGNPTEPVAVKLGEGGKFAFAGETPAMALLDQLNENAPILDGVTFAFEKKNTETNEFEATTVDLLTDAQPGTWRIVSTATADGPYDGTVYSPEFTLVEQYDLTLEPADDFSKGKLQEVTVGTATVTLDEDGKATVPTQPGTPVKLKAKRGYVIEKVETKGGSGLTYPIALSEVTTDYLGSVVTSDGNVYANVAAASAAGKTAAAVIAYMSETGHGLGIALKDDTSGEWTGSKMAAMSHSPAVSGGSWSLPSQDELKQMFRAFGGSDTSATGLNKAISAAGGTALAAGVYWSSTGAAYNGFHQAADINSSGGIYYTDYSDDGSRKVRACLTF